MNPTASIAPTSSHLDIGGAGYIGSHRVDHLPRRGCDVVAFNNHSTGYRTPVQVERGQQDA